MKLLVIDDDPRLRATMEKGLRAAGFETMLAESGQAARATLADGPVDVILLDVMLPDEEGWAILERLRGAGDRTPVIFVTARDAIDERVRGLDAGADDYIIKPFAFDELVARVQAVARRRSEAGLVTFGPLTLDRKLHLATLAGRRFELSPREFGLLAALVEARGRTLDRPFLLEEVWGVDFDPGTNIVDVHVGRLRKRFGPLGPCLVKTIKGEGYALDLSGLER